MVIKNPEERLKKMIAEASKFKKENKKILSVLSSVKSNRPQKFSATQRVLVNRGILKPKKKFKHGKNPLQFTKKGHRFYLAGKKFQKIIPV